MKRDLKPISKKYDLAKARLDDVIPFELFPVNVPEEKNEVQVPVQILPKPTADGIPGDMTAPMRFTKQAYERTAEGWKRVS